MDSKMRSALTTYWQAIGNDGFLAPGEQKSYRKKMEKGNRPREKDKKRFTDGLDRMELFFEMIKNGNKPLMWSNLNI